MKDLVQPRGEAAEKPGDHPVTEREEKFWPGPWKICGDGECSCKFIWAPDFPIAKVTAGEWGDDYPALRFAKDETPPTMGGRVEAYMERITYGSVSEEMARANAHLIAAAPELYAALKGFLYYADNTMILEAETELAAVVSAARTAVSKAGGKNQSSLAEGGEA